MHAAVMQGAAIDPKMSVRETKAAQPSSTVFSRGRADMLQQAPCQSVLLVTTVLSLRVGTTFFPTDFT
jgi:hypothetical protein